MSILPYVHVILCSPEVDMAFESLHDMFYFKVELDYIYNVTLVQSRTFEQVRADLIAKIHLRAFDFIAK